MRSAFASAVSLNRLGVAQLHRSLGLLRSLSITAQSFRTKNSKDLNGDIWRRYLFLISAAIVKKADSTFVEFLADVSKKGIPSESANSFAAL